MNVCQCERSVHLSKIVFECECERSVQSEEIE